MQMKKGSHHTEESKEKMRAALANPEVKAKMRAAARGNKNSLGHYHTPEAKARMSTSIRAALATPEAKAKRSAAQLAREPKRVADCHPDRPYGAKGLCRPCYRRAYADAHRAEMNAKIKEQYHAGRKALKALQAITSLVEGGQTS